MLPDQTAAEPDHVPHGLPVVENGLVREHAGQLPYGRRCTHTLASACAILTFKSCMMMAGCWDVLRLVPLHLI